MHPLFLMKNTHGAIQAASTATGRYHPALVAQHLVLGCHQKSWVCQQNRAEGSPDFSAALGPLPSRVRSLPLIYTCPVSKRDSPTHSSESSTITYASLLELRKIPASPAAPRTRTIRAPNPDTALCSVLGT